MATLLICILLSMSHITPIDSVELDVLFSPREPKVLVDKHGNIWYASYWDHHITKMNKQGKKIWALEGPGTSPFEIYKPISFMLVEDSSTLLVLHKQVRLTLFDAKSGDFIRKIEGFHPYAKLVGWYQGHAMVLSAPFPVDKQGLALISLENGRQKKAWFQYDSRPDAISVGSLAMALKADGTLYYQQGALPKVHQIAFGKRSPFTWPLKPPMGYVEPPNEPIPERDRYSREKVDAYYNSFSKVKQFQLINDKYLLVCWQNPSDHKYIHQAYDLDTQKIVAQNLPIKGLLIPSHDGLVYSLERIDTDDFDTDAKEILHRYEITLP